VTKPDATLVGVGSGGRVQSAESPRSAVATPDAGVVRRLAFAISRDGEDALLIDANNQSAGHVSIDEAARSGRCFAVVPSDDVLALDADLPRAVRYVIDELQPELETQKFRPVVWNSGRRNHLHLLVRISDSALKVALERAARMRGCDVRTGQRIRPPLSPHRCGLRVSLISPTTPAEAVDALARPKSLESSRKRRPFSGRIFALLREGDREGKYPSRSEVVQALALAAVNARMSEAWLFKVCLDPKNRGGEKVQQLARTKGEEEARRYVAMVYRNARQFALAHPPFRRRSDALAKFDEIERAANANPSRWKGRAGATDRAVLQAHLTIMRRSGRSEHGASVREIAILAGLDSISTVSTSQKRLEQDGHLQRLEKAKLGAAARYVVCLPNFPSRTVIPVGALEDCSAGESSPAADVFRWGGGLGKATWRVWCALNGCTVSELATLLDLKQTSLGKHLARLVVHRLAVCDPAKRWHRLDNIDAGAERLGIAGEGVRQRERYEHEREMHQQRLRQYLQRKGFRTDELSGDAKGSMKK